MRPPEPTAKPTLIAGAIIAGGQGRRMGTPHKAALVLGDGSTPVERLRRALDDAGCGPVILAANDPAPYRSLALDPIAIVPDQRPDCGPLAGIEAVLEHLTHSAAGCSACCFVPGDQPGFTADHTARLLDAWRSRQSAAPEAPAVVTAWTDRPQPLCVVVAVALLPEIRASLDRGERAVHGLWRRLGAGIVEFAADEAFLDLDDPEDLARFNAAR